MLSRGPELTMNMEAPPAWRFYYHFRPRAEFQNKVRKEQWSCLVVAVRRVFDSHRCQLTRNNGSQRLSQHDFAIEAFFACIKTLLADIKATFTPIQTFLASIEMRRECQQPSPNVRC
jgi:hypothetical protein